MSVNQGVLVSPRSSLDLIKCDLLSERSEASATAGRFQQAPGGYGGGRPLCCTLFLDSYAKREETRLGISVIRYTSFSRHFQHLPISLDVFRKVNDSSRSSHNPLVLPRSTSGEADFLFFH